ERVVHEVIGVGDGGKHGIDEALAGVGGNVLGTEADGVDCGRAIAAGMHGGHSQTRLLDLPPGSERSWVALSPAGLAAPGRPKTPPGPQQRGKVAGAALHGPIALPASRRANHTPVSPQLRRSTSVKAGGRTTGVSLRCSMTIMAPGASQRPAAAEASARSATACP